MISLLATVYRVSTILILVFQLGLLVHDHLANQGLRQSAKR